MLREFITLIIAPILVVLELISLWLNEEDDN